MDPVPGLVMIIAKVMNLLERLLDEWVEVTTLSWQTSDGTLGYIDHCGPGGVLMCNMTACGNDFIERVEDLIHILPNFITNIILGLGVVEGTEIAVGK